MGRRQTKAGNNGLAYWAPSSNVKDLLVLIHFYFEDKLTSWLKNDVLGSGLGGLCLLVPTNVPMFCCSSIVDALTSVKAVIWRNIVSMINNPIRREVDMNLGPGRPHQGSQRPSKLGTAATKTIALVFSRKSWLMSVKSKLTRLYGETRKKKEKWRIDRTYRTLLTHPDHQATTSFHVLFNM